MTSDPSESTCQTHNVTIGVIGLLLSYHRSKTRASLSYISWDNPSPRSPKLDTKLSRYLISEIPEIQTKQLVTENTTHHYLSSDNFCGQRRSYHQHTHSALKCLIRGIRGIKWYFLIQLNKAGHTYMQLLWPTKVLSLTHPLSTKVFDQGNQVVFLDTTE